MDYYNHIYTQKISRIGCFVERKVNRVLFSLVHRYIIDNLLEIGCGRGYFAEVCKEEGTDYTGIEPNKMMYEKLVSAGYNVINQSVPPIPFNDSSFGTLYCAHILEHIPGHNIYFFIKEIYTKIKKEGTLIIVAPNFNVWKNEFWNVDYTHTFITTPRRVKQLLEDNGFEIVNLTRISGVFTGVKRHIINFLVRLYPHRFLDSTIGRFFHEDFFYNGKILFLENFITVAQKR
jgi:SAM-dependent methyltransferase